MGILSWWYGRGWRARLHLSGGRLKSTAELFSIGQLLSTLFDPFRQISAGRVDGSAAVQIRAALDKLISRIVGLIVRTITILIGLVVLVFRGIFEVIFVAFWLIIPLFPVFGLVMMIFGWTPQWM